MRRKTKSSLTQKLKKERKKCCITQSRKGRKERQKLFRKPEKNSVNPVKTGIHSFQKQLLTFVN